MGERNMGMGWYGSFKGHRVYKNTISIHPFKCLPGITLGTSFADGFLVNSLALKRAIFLLFIATFLHTVTWPFLKHKPIHKRNLTLKMEEACMCEILVTFSSSTWCKPLEPD
jgi:hypothetical protein